MEQEKTDVSSKEKSRSRFDILRILLGVFLLSFGIVGGSNYTLVGEVLTYSFSYVFGMFYPFVFALISLGGLVLAFNRKIRFRKEYLLSVFGVLLLVVSCLALCSYPILLSKPNAKVIDAVSVYNDRFIGFCRYPYKVDDFSLLSNLGGGYLGLFFLSLFSNAWSRTVGCVVYSALLFVALFLIVLYPLVSLFEHIRIKKENRVVYSSGNQNGAVDRTLLRPTIRNDEVFDDIDLHADFKSKNSDSKEFVKQGAFSSPLKSETLDTENKVMENKDDYKHPSMEMHVVDPLVEKDRFDDQKNNSQALFTTKSYHDDSEEEKADEKKETEKTEVKKSVGDDSVFKHSVYVKEEAKPSVAEPVKKKPSVVVKALEEKFTVNREAVNPLVEQARNVSFKAEQAPVSNEVSLDDPKEEKAKAESSEAIKEEDETSSEEALEALFFEMKEKRANIKKNEIEAEKKKKMSLLLRYVDDKPKEYLYSLPNDSLLEDSDSGDKMQLNKDAALEKAKVINKVFEDFHFPAKAVSFTIGASVTRFNIQTEPGVKADKMESLLSELQRALKGDQSVRIQTVVEGRSTSGIEVGNAKQMPVSFKSMFMEIEKNTKDNLLLPIGKDISGNIVTYPLNEMPHLLVAGTTGSGKSVLINCMIMTLIMRNYPSQLKLMLIDPKQVEFAKYNMEPHLLCPVIQDSDSAIVALKKLVDEMERRYTILKENNVVKISEYRKIQQLHPDSMEELPDIAVFIDEFADLMSSGGALIADYVKTLTAKSRASGIYLVIATQRPSKDNIPMTVKGNITVRVGLSCSSQVDSRVILDENGCETLVGKGDLLFKSPGRRSLLRCQSAFISDSEMDRVLDYLKGKAGDPSYNKDFLDLEVKSEEEDSQTQMTLDDLFDDVKEFVMYTGICSRSSIMRNFSLSYSKADQMLARLRNVGIIKPMQGGKNVVVVRKKMEN